MNLSNNETRADVRARAVLWDMDGTLIDSIPYHLEAWQHVLRQINRTVEPRAWNQTAGMRNSEIIPLLFPDMSPEQAQYVDQAKEVRYRELIESAGHRAAARRGRMDSTFSDGRLETGHRLVGPARKRRHDCARTALQRHL